MMMGTIHSLYHEDFKQLKKSDKISLIIAGISLLIALFALCISVFPYLGSSSNKLGLQIQCANQAEKALVNFEQETGNGYIDYAQQNHYNPQFNKCFALISYVPITPVGTVISTKADAYAHPTNIETLEDAYENTDLADCTYYGNLPGVDPSTAGNPGAYTSCFIGNNKADYQQYKEFVSQRMDLSEQN